MYRGKKYAEERETGYLVCTSGKRKRLHVVMYETERLGGAEVPEGYVIHHKDWNKRNNVIDNLVMVTVQEHNLIHNPPPLDKMGREERKIYEDLKNRGLIINN